MSSNGGHPVQNPTDEHHVRRKYCENRPQYRRSRQLTAVRAYSVANESRHLLVFGVPQIELQREVRQAFSRIGPVEKVENVTAAWQQEHGGQDQEADPLALDPFTDVFHVCFKKLEKARRAKRALDAHNFYGGLLHISYAPERETVEEVRAKLVQRRSEVRYRTKVVRLKPKPKAKQDPKQEPRPEVRPAVGSVSVKQRRRSAIIATASRMAAKMFISAEVQCRTCNLVFCCAKCRVKHEDGNHPEMAMIRKICYICNNRPFPLRRDTVISPNNLLLAHVLKEHLPLRCNSCTQLFISPDDFKKIGKCFRFCPTAAAAEKQGGCLLESQREVAKIPVPARRTTVDDDEDKENVAKATAVIVPTVAEPKQRPQKRRSIPPSGDLYPVPEPQQETGEEVDEALLTPLTKINLRWKRKSRQSFDSLLSTTANNNSSTSENIRVAEAGGQRPKLVRSTSTPMYQWQILPSMKVSNDSFTATLGQMSSIHCSSGSDTDSRGDDICSPPPLSAPLQPPAPEIVVAEPSPAEDFHKVRAIIRNQSKVAATPLRQVMSKSIQRAIAQHTQHTRQQQYQQLGAYSKMLQPGTQRKMSFSSTISSVGNDSTNHSTIASPVPDPLDLRTTPAMKRGGKEARTKSMTTVQPTIASAVGEVQQQGEEHETEYYETHRDLESLRAADETTAAERENRENNWKLHADGGDGIAQPANRSYERTPKSSGTLLKKVISFHGISTVVEADKNDTENEADEEDVWGTPCAVVPPMRSYSCSAVGLGNTFLATSSPLDPESEAYADEVFSVSTELNVPKEKTGSHKDYEMGDGKMAGPVGGGGGSRLWSIVSNVIRLASRSDVIQEDSPHPSAESSAQSVGGGIVRRAMSFADYLKTRYSGEHGGAARRTSSSGSDEYRVAAASNCKKRKRATSVYTSRSTYSAVGGNGPPPLLPSVTKGTYSPAAKRKRIQARQPIHRLRHGSDDSGSN